MAESQNTAVEYKVKGISYLGLSSYGVILVGDRAFEFYNEKNTEDYIQIPWQEIEYVAASVMFRGRYIPRFGIITKKSGTFNFSSRNNRALLQAIRPHMPEGRMVRSLTFLQVMKRGIRSLFHRHKKC